MPNRYADRWTPRDKIPQDADGVLERIARALQSGQLHTMKEWSRLLGDSPKTLTILGKDASQRRPGRC
jgi:hypothetical protein